MINPLLTSNKPLSVSFSIEADNSASVVDGSVLRQSLLYEPNLPRTQALLKVYCSLCSLCARWLNAFNQTYKNMQNKPNFRRFCAKNTDPTKKQTQTEPNQTRSAAEIPCGELPCLCNPGTIFTPKKHPQNPIKPPLGTPYGAIQTSLNLYKT